MSFADEVEVYDPRRYLAVISVLDYQGSAAVDDIDWRSHAHPSLEPEVKSLQDLGLIVEDENGEYRPKDEYSDDFEEIGYIVQVEKNGKWEETVVSELDEDRAEILGLVT